MKLDDKDRAILEILQVESNIANVELARRLEMPPATALDRVRKLERKGVIRQYAALLDAHKVGFATLAFVDIELVSHSAEVHDEFLRQIQACSEIMECYLISGQADYHLKVAVGDLQDYRRFLREKLQKIQGIARIHTSFALEAVKQSTRFPLPNNAD